MDIMILVQGDYDIVGNYVMPHREAAIAIAMELCWRFCVGADADDPSRQFL